MAAPSMTLGSAGNGLASQSLAASAAASFNVDFSAAFEGQLQLGATFGAVATTAGLQVQVYRRIGSTPVADTQPITTFTIPATASTATAQSVALPTGRYKITLTNLDATNGVTAVYCTDDTVSAVA